MIQTQSFTRRFIRLRGIIHVIIAAKLSRRKLVWHTFRHQIHWLNIQILHYAICVHKQLIRRKSNEQYTAYFVLAYSVMAPMPSVIASPETTMPWRFMAAIANGGVLWRPRLVQRPSLITHRSGQGSIDSWQDPAVDGGRSILFTNGTVYVGKGVFWRQDSAGSVFGPH